MNTKLGAADLSNPLQRQDPVARAEPAHAPLPGMARIPAGAFNMGARKLEHAPSRRVAVRAFWMDIAPVSNRMFARFVRATGYVTLAERALDPAEYPGAPHELLQAGSRVFAPGREQANLNDWTNWWAFRFGACWRHPYGINSSLIGIEDHPVVHIAYADALAFAQAAGKDLPTETEWEYAARGRLENTEYPWGDELMPDDRHMANIWQGTFPFQNLGADGYRRTSPVQTYPSNGYGLYDMVGNVWEWTSDAAAIGGAGCNSCCPAHSAELRALARDRARSSAPAKILKGGSFLSAPNYCRSFHAAARRMQPVDATACDIGFRCIVREERLNRAAQQEAMSG